MSDDGGSMSNHSGTRPLVSVISPVYGCNDCLAKLAQRTREAFETEAFDWELILVDDRGPEDAWPLIEKFAKEDEHIRGLRLMRNHGQHLAIWAGFAEVRGDWVAVVDCDLQDDPKMIPVLINVATERELDALIVERGAWKDSTIRRVLSAGFWRVFELLSGYSLRNIGNFGVYSRQMKDILLKYEDAEVFLPIMVASTGLPRGTYQVDRSERAAGQSSYGFLKLLRMAVAIIVRFSARPLTISVLLGFGIAGVSAFISLLLLICWSLGLFGVPGWTSSILSTWFLSGVILAALGIHGIYVGRIFREVQPRPRILLQSTTDDDETKGRT